MRSTVIVLFILFFSFTVNGQKKPGEKLDFQYLDISGNIVRTIHAAKYKIHISSSFKFLGVLNHQATYNDIGFNVSMAVFSRGKDLILIHAEKHTDGSGGLDYSDLEPAKLSGLPFTHRTQCASSEDKEELDNNPQISFVRSKGFDLSIPFQLEQYFTTSKDGTSEIVISYGRAVKECSEVTGAGLRKELAGIVKVEKSAPGCANSGAAPESPAFSVFMADRPRGIRSFLPNK